MLKAGIAAASLLAVVLSVPAGMKQAEALPVAKPAVQEANVKHEVGRRGFRGHRGFRRHGFRGHRGFRRHGFRGHRGFRRHGFRGHRGFRRHGFRRHRFRGLRFGHRYGYYGVPYVSYGYRSRCRHWKRRAKYTGDPYYWEMYKRCKFGYGNRYRYY